MSVATMEGGEWFEGLGSLDEHKMAPRRKSWHIKMERKRRKGVAAAAPQDRHRRPSWWNIFVPEHWPSRSRRASQDLPRSGTTKPPFFRSKSRSVDHGFSTPFDLDSLRSKVEGRFESVDKLAKDSDGAGKESERKVARSLPPEQTITYTVEANDTLTSVAARFDTTPSELAKLNRLGTRLIFPGQVLYVPDKRAQEEDANEPPMSAGITVPALEEKDILDNLRPVSPKPDTILQPGNAQSDDGSHKQASESQDHRAGRRSAERFLKINVRHITDGQGVVGGVLLVTPNAVMFDPNVSDPLVIEHGAEMYGVIAPMEFVVNAAIYYDIAHMRVGHHHTADIPRPEVQKPEIYHPKAYLYNKTECNAHNSPGKDSLLVKDETFPELAPARSSDDDNESLCSCPDRENVREGDAFPKAFERELVTPTNLQQPEETDHQKEEEQATAEDDKNAVEVFRAVEERRKSCLDHHWPTLSVDKSLDKESDDVLPAEKQVEPVQEEGDDDNGPLVKLSCHDSGIDIRGDAEAQLPLLPVLPSKKVYSDADIILAPKTDFIPPLTNAVTGFVNSSSVDSTSSSGDGSSRKKTSSVSFSLDSNQDGEAEADQKLDDPEKQESKKNKMLKRLSYPLAWMEGLTGDKDEKDALSSLPQAADGQQHSSMFSKVFSRRSSVGTFIRQHESRPPAKQAAPKLDYRSMVSVDDMPELFASFDKLIPRPARSCEDPPLYLTLRMGKPLNRKIPKSTPIMSYGKKKMRPEYWFSVPRNRVDDLYNFLLLWVPQLYGDLEAMDFKERGYELVESDTELWDDENGDTVGKVERPGDDEDLADITRESWEVLSMNDELRRALYANSVASLDLEMFIPDLAGTTEILTEEHRKKLCRHLPARAEGYVWTLVFSTLQHGFSLNSMYRKMNRLESPILMVIEDTEHNVFGALTSCALKVSDHFYGTGESLLFRFSPEFQVFNWTGDNMYFIKGNNESLAIGAGDGKFGLWLDGDLYQGRTQRCSTYGNEPLAPKEDFVVKTLECWAFI